MVIPQNDVILFIEIIVYSNVIRRNWTFQSEI